MRSDQVKPNYPAPPYVSGSTRERDELLSQVGNFSHTERRLFHLLCAIWEPEIPYTRALGQADRETAKLSAALPSLMEKLQRGRTGLVLTEVLQGARHPRALLLTAERSGLFFVKLVEEQWQALLADPALPFPGVRTLAELKLQLPRAYARPATMTELVGLTLAPAPSEYFVLVIDIPDSYEVYLPSTRPAVLVPAVLHKLRHCLDNTNLVSLIAELNNSKLTEIKRRIDSSDANSWRIVVATILKERSTLKNSAIMVPDDLFVAAEIMRRYIESRAEAARRRQLSDGQVAELALTIEQAVRHTATAILSVTEFDSMLDQQLKGDGVEARQLRLNLVNRLTTPPSGRYLPRIVRVDDVVVHRANVYLVLLQRLSHVADLVRKEYIRDMQLMLQSADRERYLYFYTTENWEADIEQRVAARDPLIPELLEQPELVAEALVHAARSRLHISDPRQIKRSLEVMFEPGGLTLRPYSQLLSLDICAIFEVAYARAGLLRQFVMRISGRLELMRQRFAEVAGPTARADRVAGRDRIMDVLADLERGSTDAPDRTTGAAASHGSPGAGALPEAARPRWGGIGSRRKNSDVVKVRRPYSRKQRESAWEEFEKTIRKKP